MDTLGWYGRFDYFLATLNGVKNCVIEAEVDTDQVDARGNKIEVATFGVDGTLVLNSDGYARITAKRDATGTLISTIIYDTNGDISPPE
jgi:hypothetical protein